MSITSEQIKLEDDESLVIDLSVIAGAIRQNLLKIIATALLVAALGAVYAFTVYQEKYVSEGTLLFNPSELPNVVSEINTQSHFLEGASTTASNPFKNQEELLKSTMLAKRTLAAIRKEGIELPIKKPGQLLDKVLKSEHVNNTDFIRVTATSSLPSVSQKIANAYMDSYLAIIHEISYAPLMHQKQLYEKQLAQVNDDVHSLNTTLQRYQEQYGIVDISMESQSKVTQQENIRQELKKSEVELAEKKAESAQLYSQLKMKPNDLALAIQSVAGGQDLQLAQLQEKLHAAQEDYNTKALVYAPTNPDMKQLAEKIAILNKQILDQQILTIGNAPKAKSLLIKDPLRAEMVNRLAMREAEISALNRKRATLDVQYQGMMGELKDIPRQQLEYARLKFDKQHKETLQSLLQDKLAEVKIQEAAVQKKLMVIDPPSLPDAPLFPNRVHIVLLAAAVGLAVASLMTGAIAVWKPKIATAESIETLLNLPVLSVIPWLPERQWQTYRKRKTLEVLSAPSDSEIVKSYQSLALNLKLQRNATGKNALAVSALFDESGQSFILANLALCLAQSGERVVLIDTNLKQPRLHQLFGHGLSYEHGLTEVINSLAEYSSKRQNSTPQELLPLVQSNLFPSGIHPQLLYLNAGVVLDNTFEFLNSKGFSALVSTLKQHYDWVLFDAPPLLDDLDTSVLLAYLDGLLLCVERDSDEEQLRQARQKVHRMNSNILGCILRGE